MHPSARTLHRRQWRLLRREYSATKVTPELFNGEKDGYNGYTTNESNGSMLGYRGVVDELRVFAVKKLPLLES